MSHVQWGHSEARILIDLLNPKKKENPQRNEGGIIDFFFKKKTLSLLGLFVFQRHLTLQKPCVCTGEGREAKEQETDAKGTVLNHNNH